ncbi:hypothetical protein [Pseudacidovorax sp. RU35E]|uniref:hypothetical protein n=1 Tax=Pseudacidovorax sp. RU35E TaxID=1907403 RepID=UPI000953E195|nr:hypothetical protein [Pseudacidovorax sp. RU35E]SIR07064.1 hypothetical protein SAMN05880557_107310 [Pseudacidovorax sp. RU35E]
MELEALSPTRRAWHAKVVARYFPPLSIPNPGQLGALSHFPSRQPSVDEVFLRYPMPDDWQATDPLPLM